MPSLNKVILIGNLVADPELKQTQNGIPVCSFRIGVARRFKNTDGTYTSDFFDIVAWRATAEFVCRFFRKGKPICICGSLQTRSWTDQQGNKRWVTEVVADEATFVESRSDNPGYGVSQGNTQYASQNNYGTQQGQASYQQYSAPQQDQYSAPSYSSDDSQGPKNFEIYADDDDLPF